MEEKKKWVRVGLIVPSSNAVMEVDLYRALPQWSTLHTARMFLEEVNRAGEERMIFEFVPQAADSLRTVNPHLVIFGCTSAGSLYGMEFDAKITRDIAEKTKAKTIGVLTSVSEELRKIGAKRLAVITPYIKELNETIKKSLQESGYEVLSIDGMNISVNFDIAKVTPEEILSFAKEKLKGTRADCLFFSCTNLRAVDALPLLKKHFSLPIVTSNYAAIQATMRIIKGME